MRKGCGSLRLTKTTVRLKEVATIWFWAFGQIFTVFSRKARKQRFYVKPPGSSILAALLNLRHHRPTRTIQASSTKSVTGSMETARSKIKV